MIGLRGYSVKGMTIPVIIAFACLTFSCAHASRLRTDCNADGTVDVFDVAVVARAMGSVFFPPYADVNGDGVVNLYDLVLVAKDFLKVYDPYEPPIAPAAGAETIWTLIALQGGADTTYDMATEDSTVTGEVGLGGTDLTIVAADHQGGADHSDVRIFLLFPADVAQAIIDGEITLSIKNYEVPGGSAPTLGTITAGTPTYYAWSLGGEHSAYTHYMEVTFSPAVNLVAGWTLNPGTGAPYGWDDVELEESSVGQASYAEIIVTVSNSGDTPFTMHVDSAGIPSTGEMAWNPYSHDGTFYGTVPRVFTFGTVPLLPEMAIPVGVGLAILVVSRRRKGR